MLGKRTRILLKPRSVIRILFLDAPRGDIATPVGIATTWSWCRFWKRRWWAVDEVKCVEVWRAFPARPLLGTAYEFQLVEMVVRVPCLPLLVLWLVDKTDASIYLLLWSGPNGMTIPSGDRAVRSF